MVKKLSLHNYLPFENRNVAWGLRHGQDHDQAGRRGMEASFASYRAIFAKGDEAFRIGDKA